MEKVFEIAEKLENKLLAMQEPIFIRDFVINSIAEVNNENVSARMKKMLTSIDNLNTEWDHELRKVLGRDISNIKKRNILNGLEERILKFEEKSSDKNIEEAVNKTTLGSDIRGMYRAGYKDYKKVIEYLVTNYKDVFLKYNESLVISDNSSEPKSKKIQNVEVTIPHRIGWVNDLTIKNETIKFEEFFKKLINDGSVSLGNGKSNTQEIIKILRLIFDVVIKVNSDRNKSKVQNSAQILPQRLLWNHSLDKFCETFGQLINYKGESILFLDFSKRGAATPIGRVLFIAFVINKKVNGQEPEPIKLPALLTALRTYSVKK